MKSTIIVALIGFAGTFCGSYFSHRKSTALIEYKLEQLEKKVDKHNNIIERTYKLEEKVIDTDNRLDKLEGGIK